MRPTGNEQGYFFRFLRTTTNKQSNWFNTDQPKNPTDRKCYISVFSFLLFLTLMLSVNRFKRIDQSDGIFHKHENLQKLKLL